MSTTTDLGKVGITPKQTYNSTTAYERLDIVTHDGCSYMCLKNCTGVAVSNTEYWQLLADKGHFTQEDKEEFKQAVVEDSKTEINEHTETKKTELDNYTTTKETSLKNELDTYTETKESELDTHKTTLETEMTNTKNSLVEEIETAQNGFDTNAQTKLQEYNNNATAKTTAFNNNVTEKTNTFNSNVETKTTEFNTNSAEKLNEYNENATEKIGTFNSNAQAKTEEYNANAEALTNRITELEGIVSQMPAVEGSGSDFKLDNTIDAQILDCKVMGATWQQQYSGKNQFNQEYYNNKELYTKFGNYYVFVKLPDSFKKSFYASTFLKEDAIGFTCGFIESPSNVFSGGIKILDAGKTKTNVACDFSNAESVYFAIGNSETINIDTDVDTFFSNCNVQVTWENDTTNEFEKYVGGTASPNVQFPQEIHNVSGDILIKTHNKNLADFNVLNSVPSISTGELVAFNNGASSDFIKIDNAKEYILTYDTISASAQSIYLLYYNSDKKYLGNKSIPTTKKIQLSVFENYNNTAYIKIRADNIKQIKFCQLEQNSVETPYAPCQSVSTTFPLAEGQKLMEGDYLADDGIHSIDFNDFLDGTEKISEYNQSTDELLSFSVKLKSEASKDIIYGAGSDIKSTHFVQRGLGSGPNSIQLLYQNNVYGIVSKKDFSTIDDLKAFFAEQYANGTPVRFQFKLNNEIVTPYIPEQQRAYNELKKLRSFRDTTYIVTSSDDLAPIAKVKALEKTAGVSEIKDIKQAILSLGGNV